MASDRVTLYKQQISQFEGEIERLCSKIDAKSQLCVGTQSLSQLKASRDNEAAASGTNLDEDLILDKLNEEFNVLKTLTGIELDEVTGIPDGESDPNSCNQMRYRAKGSSNGVVFQLNFNVTQTENDVTVSNLEMDSIEKVNNDLGPLFDELEAQQWIQGFPLVFVPYAKLRSERRRTFTYIQEKFGGAIQLPEGVTGSKIEFCHKLDEKIIFRLTWDFIISSPHSMSRRIHLDIDAPKSAMQNDVLKKAPEMLDMMTQSLGPQAAIEALIKSSVLDQNDVPLHKDTT